jgi:hypothetical protein
VVPGKSADPKKIPEKVGAINPIPGPITVGATQRTYDLTPSPF